MDCLMTVCNLLTFVKNEIIFRQPMFYCFIILKNQLKSFTCFSVTPITLCNCILILFEQFLSFNLAKTITVL